MATKPFLVINLPETLEKSWREEAHPRDKHGKFTTVKGGSRVVTKHGKTGVVKKVAGDKYHIDYDDGSSGAVKKDNALHTNDHAKVEKEKKKQARKRKTAGKKQSKTKAQKKANGTSTAKTVKDPTKKTKKKASAKKTATASKTKKQAPAKKTATASKTKKQAPKKQAPKKQAPKKAPAKKKDKAQQAFTNYGLPPEVKNKEIPKGANSNNTPQNKDVKDFKDFGKKEADRMSIDASMASNEVQRLLSKPANKRSEKDIQRIAGQITEENKKLAFSIANKRANMMGFGVMKNRIGNVNAKDPKFQETGARFEMIQSGLGAMYETLHNVLSGAENPNGSIGAHVTSRMKQKITKDLYGLLNTIPAPHEVRSAIGEMKKAENVLTQHLGRTPSEKEMGEYLMANSKAFKEAPIVKPARWDEKKDQWVATNKQETDPEERYKALKRYADQQRTASMDKQVGKEGEREITVGDTLAVQDENRTPEETYERKERQQELQGAIPKALKQMKLSDTQIDLYSIMYSAPSDTRKQAFRTLQETVDIYNKKHGTDFGDKWAYKHINEGRKLIAQAVAENHPAVDQLRMFKSFIFSMIIKSIFEYDLVKSLHSWGMDTTALEETYTRTAFGRNLTEVRKSLAPTEYIGSYVTIDTGHVRAHIVEYSVPGNDELMKSFLEFGTELRKSMFPHKGGSNSAVNAKASEYVKSNKSKYQGMHKSQQARLKEKQSSGKQLTWSEELAIKEKGFWISWGGKKILIKGEGDAFGDVAYDSANEAHRQDVADNSKEDISTQEENLEFHHEKEGLEDHKKAVEDEAQADHEKGEYKNAGKTNKKKWAEKHGVKLTEDGELDLNDDGKLQFDHSNNEESYKKELDHGLQAFRDEQENLRKQWGDAKNQVRDDHGHKVHEHYTSLDEEGRKAYDAMSPEERAKATGDYHLGKDHLKDRLEQFHQDVQNAESDDHKRQLGEELLEDMNALHKEHKDIPSALRNKRNMLGRGKNLGGLLGDFADSEGIDSIADAIGKGELAESRTQAGKSLVKEGKYIVGNPATGKQLILHASHDFQGGRGGKGGQFTSVVKEAFDPQTGEHYTFEGAKNSWGDIAHKLGFSRSTKFGEDANKDGHPLMKEIDEDEYSKARKNTKAGLQDEMIHKKFEKVDEARKKKQVYTGKETDPEKQKADKKNWKYVDTDEIASRTFAQDMPDGTQNVFEVDDSGFITDPTMRRLLNQREPIETEEDLHNALKKGVGNTMWSTLHVGSDIHSGDALGHHVKLQYDGKGAPRVVGGAYDGYRYIDSADVPKGAVDPATGEPVKALFKNGKLVDRRFSTKNDVPMEEGNPVMYRTEDGKYKKGRINAIQDGKYKVTDGHGHVIGMFDKKDLKNAREDGKINSESKGAVVKLAQHGVHRMNISEAMQDATPKQQKKLEEALRKAGIKKAFDEEGNFNIDNLELTDPMMKKMRKNLQRSKLGRSILNKFTSSYTNELEMHVPDHLRSLIEGEGVKVKKDGTARISTGKFEQLRDVLNGSNAGLSLEQHARNYLGEHFRMKDRTFQDVETLRTKYQPSALNSGNSVLDDHYKSMFKESSFLRNPEAGLFSTQLEGIGHLVERGRGIAGHGMGTGKTILGVMAGMHYKAKMMAENKTPKKTLIVAPKGIMSDWGKEIGGHTNSKALYIGNLDGGTHIKDEKGNKTGKKMWGQAGTEQEAVHPKHFGKNMDKLGSEDHDFHVMSYETFAKMKDKLVGSGLYDNIAIDEVHAFKNAGSNRGKSLSETTDKFKNVWGLSGTPMENDAREIYSLIDTVTGGKHELGSKKEFEDKFMIKDKSGKITGVKPGMEDTLGDAVANVVQFRHGKDVTKNDGSKIQFPALAGSKESNDKMDFIGNMVDGSRDHNTNEYYGTKHSVADFERHTVNPSGEDGKGVEAFAPKGLSPEHQKVYDRYQELQQKYLPESKLKELVQATSTGYDKQKGGSNYLTGMQKLQKFLNAPLAEKMYTGEGKGNAIEDRSTDAQAEPGAKKGKKKAEGMKAFSGGMDKLHEWKPGDGHYVVDDAGHKRYFESDGKGSVARDADGKPKVLPPLHHNNPKAQYLKERLGKYLDSVQSENTRRRANGEPEIMPKVVVKSDFTTFGTDIVDGVLRDLQHPKNGHPELRSWHNKTEGKLGAGQFTGQATDREDTKIGFRGDKKDYANNQGHLWATTVSPAGKEGVDFGNAHMMFHFDQNWNPQKMAQYTARVRRADSHEKAHESVGRANAVRVESLHMPGTIEDFLFSAQDRKMEDIKTVEDNTRSAERSTKYGDSTPKTGKSSRAFTRSKKRKAGRKPKGSQKMGVKAPKTTGGKASDAVAQGKAVASAEKSLKFVVLL